MNEYRFASCGKDQIGFSWEVTPVQPETVAQLVNQGPHCNLGLRVLAADCSHVLAAIHSSSDLKLLAKPLQDGDLLILARSPDLGQ